MTDTNLHLERNFVGYANDLPNPGWPNDARLALNFCINFEEGSEESVPDGYDTSETGLSEANTTGFVGRDLAAESMFEYGSRVGFWRLHRLFSERNLPATIFACAVALERNRPASEAIRNGNYDICAHGWRWERHQNLTPEQEMDRISKATRSIEQTTGKKPLGWYCRYGPSLNTRRLVVENGQFLYDSDSYNDELPYWTKVGDKKHLIVPYSLVTNDLKYIRGNYSTGQDFFEYLKETFDFLYAEGATQPRMMSVGLHLRLVGHPGRAAGLQKFLDYVLSFQDVWICQRRQIAEHWHKRHTS